MLKKEMLKELEIRELLGKFKNKELDKGSLIISKGLGDYAQRYQNREDPFCF